MVFPARGNGVYPLFVFNDGKGKDLDINGLSLSMERSLRVRHVRRGSDGKVRSYSVDSEEYVVL